jgi:hypothetical protein
MADVGGTQQVAARTVIGAGWRAAYLARNWLGSAREKAPLNASQLSQLASRYARGFTSPPLKLLTGEHRQVKLLLRSQ